MMVDAARWSQVSDWLMHDELVVRATGGDRDAFTALATAAFDRLYRTARLILRDDDAAADAVQEALVSAWVHIRAVRDPVHVEWLRRQGMVWLSRVDP